MCRPFIADFHDRTCREAAQEAISKLSGWMATHTSGAKNNNLRFVEKTEIVTANRV